MTIRILSASLLGLFTSSALAQGQDSTFAERDIAVIATMLPGIYDNSNQTYFEFRGKQDEALKHKHVNLRIGPLDNYTSPFEIIWRDLEDDAEPARSYSATLMLNDERSAVLMSLAGAAASCTYRWQREPMQFRARPETACADTLPAQIVLSEQQLWVQPGKASKVAVGNPYELHRAREFQCYADIPGVGGGRPIPYDRFDNFTLHDRGDTFWFDSKDTPPRRLGVALWQVDWPLNNYEGVFTRDSLVIYISEKVDGETIEHGYSFVQSDATRIGINLKWILATCFLESNAVARPSM